MLSQRQRHDERASTPAGEALAFQYATQLVPQHHITQRILDDLEAEADQLSVSKDEFNMTEMLEDAKTVLNLASALLMPLAPASTILGVAGSVVAPLIQGAYADDEADKRGFMQEALMGAVFELGGEFLLGPIVKRLIQSPVAKAKVYDPVGDAGTGPLRFDVTPERTEQFIQRQKGKPEIKDVEDEVLVPQLTSVSTQQQRDVDMLEKIFSPEMKRYAEIDDTADDYAVEDLKKFIDEYSGDKASGNIDSGFFGDNRGAVDDLKSKLEDGELKSSFEFWGAAYWTGARSNIPQGLYVAKVMINRESFIITPVVPSWLRRGALNIVETESNWLRKYDSALKELSSFDIHHAISKMVRDSDLEKVKLFLSDYSGPGSYHKNAVIINKPIWYKTTGTLRSYTISPLSGGESTFQVVYKGVDVTVNKKMLGDQFVYYEADGIPAKEVIVSSHGDYGSLSPAMEVKKGNTQVFLGPHDFALTNPGLDTITNITDFDPFVKIMSDRIVVGKNKKFGVHTNNKTNMELKGVDSDDSEFMDYTLSYFQYETPFDAILAVAKNAVESNYPGAKVTKKGIMLLREHVTPMEALSQGFSLPRLSDAWRAVESLPNKPDTLISLHCRNYAYADKNTVPSYTVRGYIVKHDVASRKIRSRQNVVLHVAAKEIVNEYDDHNERDNFDLTDKKFWLYKALWRNGLALELLDEFKSSIEIAFTSQAGDRIKIERGALNASPYWTVSYGKPEKNDTVDMLWAMLNDDFERYCKQYFVAENQVNMFLKINGNTLYDGDLSDQAVPVQSKE